MSMLSLEREDTTNIRTMRFWYLQLVETSSASENKTTMNTRHLGSYELKVSVEADPYETTKELESRLDVSQII